jgi:hypothetical protein
MGSGKEGIKAGKKSSIPWREIELKRARGLEISCCSRSSDIV